MAVTKRFCFVVGTWANLKRVMARSLSRSASKGKVLVASTRGNGPSATEPLRLPQRPALLWCAHFFMLRA